MIKILPVVFLIILISAGLIYWRFFALKSSSSNLIGAKVSETQGPVEVPKTLPNATVENRVKILEEALIEIVKRVNSLSDQGQAGSSTNSQLNSIEASITDLKTRVIALEQATPAPAAASSSKSTVYIPLGAGGQISDTNWANLNTFQISLEPASYAGYSSMQLEVNMRLNQPGGQVFARLYNSSSGSVTSSEISSTSTTSSVVTSNTFTLPAGTKNYVLQAKSKDGSQAFIDYTRIKVNF